MKNQSLEKLNNSRKGGSIAIKGFHYQKLYSIYIALKKLKGQDSYIQLEGLEDVDSFSVDNQYEHIQLKDSTNAQSASFLDSVLKTYLEVYLNSDEERSFKLVYNFQLKEGNLTKLIKGKLDTKSREFWKNKIKKILKEKLNQTLEEEKIDVFMESLNFEFISKETLETEIPKLLIEKFHITTGNEESYVHALLYEFTKGMMNKKKYKEEEIRKIILDVKDSISKGSENPAYKWIKKIKFNSPKTIKNYSYYQGKKATKEDIENNLPVVRTKLEKKLSNSINENRITVIKSSSGQGKSSLGWRSLFLLKEEFEIYEIINFNNKEYINSTVEYIRTRLKIGRKIILFIDNLDLGFKEWSFLAFELNSEEFNNCKLLLTTREDDWFSYSGDQSKIKGLNIINIKLEQEEAKEIFLKLNEKGKVKKENIFWEEA